MPLNTHSSGGQPIDYSGPGGINVQVYEGGGWLSRRSVWWLIHVFLGASFMSTWQAEDAVRNGYASNVLWGRDYRTPKACPSTSTTRTPRP